MKDRTLVYLSFALSIVSLGYAAWVHQHSEELAMRALHKREAELVQHWRPKFDNLFEGMGTNAMRQLKSPTTLEELFDPLVTILNGIADPQSGIGPHERLGWYVPYLPQRLIIERFYETPNPSMDHEYMWKIKIDGSEEFKRFWQQFSSAPPNVDGVNDYDSVAIFARHPEWWKEIDFRKGMLFKYRVSVIGSGGQKADVFALFDKDAGYVYIQAF